MKNKKKNAIIFGSIILILICGVLITMFLPKKINPESIAITDILIGDKEITLKGTLTDSAIGYSDNKVSKSGGKIYLEILGGFSLGKMNSNFIVTLNKDKYGEPNEIYLKDGKKTVKIWPK